MTETWHITVRNNKLSINIYSTNTKGISNSIQEILFKNNIIKKIPLTYKNGILN